MSLAPSANAALLRMGWWADAGFAARNDVLQNDPQFFRSWCAEVLIS